MANIRSSLTKCSVYRTSWNALPRRPCMSHPDCCSASSPLTTCAASTRARATFNSLIARFTASLSALAQCSLRSRGRSLIGGGNGGDGEVALPATSSPPDGNLSGGGDKSRLAVGLPARSGKFILCSRHPMNVTPMFQSRHNPIMSAPVWATSLLGPSCSLSNFPAPRRGSPPTVTLVVGRWLATRGNLLPRVLSAPPLEVASARPPCCITQGVVPGRLRLPYISRNLERK